ncbi:TPA: hypothetical protein MJC92_000235 [Clostridioides difficile]|uniref:hypothetical protein n=1 Tax=Clostridioides difficile TaxID=1496 RepID=UPI00038CD048|nr:hypothetical protein [Clostridioides difficile]EQG35321.1 HTH domain protein [Clostridioides difficile DA00126]EQG92208.1 HTH domain protein [Clostridioides difficile DA00191]MBY1307217.1 hypothetical protein [Clostridioides difficile]MCL1007221.1 hypothetical protein [Clostridioides difficile]MCR1601215.1 hypothetical protein [Clostridioides difficile]
MGEKVIIDSKESNINLIIERAAKAAAEKAIQIYKVKLNEEATELYNRKIRNTKLLLKHYREFKKHIDNSVFKVSCKSGNAIEVLTTLADRYVSEDLFVESISKSVSRTNVIIAHIDIMLKIYKEYCNNSNDIEQRRYRIIEERFIKEVKHKKDRCSINKIAKRENIDTRTVYKDIDQACERLAALIFGVDGIKKY